MWNMELQVLREWETIPSNLAGILESHHLHLHLEDENLTIPQAAVWTTLMQNVFGHKKKLKSEEKRRQGAGKYLNKHQPLG